MTWRGDEDGDNGVSGSKARERRKEGLVANGRDGVWSLVVRGGSEVESCPCTAAFQLRSGSTWTWINLDSIRLAWHSRRTHILAPIHTHPHTYTSQMATTSSPPPPPSERVQRLRSLPTIREQCYKVFKIVEQQGKGDYFDYHPDNMDKVVDYCLKIIQVRSEVTQQVIAHI